MSTISIDRETCQRCGLCTQACPNLIFETTDSGPAVCTSHAHTCFLCGQCLAVCPADAITIQEFPRDTLAPLSSETLSVEQLAAFFARRRSIRAYQPRTVDEATVRRALDLAALAPVSFPPWQVEVTTLLGHGRIQALAETICRQLENMVAMNKTWLGRLFIKKAVGREAYRFMNEFFIPLLALGIEKYRTGHVDVWLRSAPAVMIFHTPPGALDGATDSVLAASQAALALQALGLGVCFNGLIPGVAKNCRSLLAPDIPADHTIHTAFTFGYPRFAYRKSVHRPFRAVRFLLDDDSTLNNPEQ